MFTDWGFSSLSPLASCGILNTGFSLGFLMDIKELRELFYAFGDAGIMVSFGRDCITNIPKHSDSDDTGRDIMFHDVRERASTPLREVCWEEGWEECCGGGGS